MVSDAEIVEQLKTLLTTVDFQTTTERMIRQQLESHFKEDLTSKKLLIKEEINNYFEQQQNDEDDDTEGDVEDDEASGDAEEEEQEREAVQDTGGAMLSEAMQEFLGVSSMRRPDIVKELWVYIKAKNLQDPKNKKIIRLDEKLSKLFTAPLNMLSMNQQLSKHVKGGGVRAKRPAAAKKAKKAKGDDDEAPKRGNSNFSKPLKISKDLQDFLGQEEASRGEITKKFWNYFKEKKLQDPKDKRWILADDTLKNLLGSNRFQGFSISKLVQPHIL